MDESIEKTVYKIISKKITGKTLSDIFHDLNSLDFYELSYLCQALKCSIDELAVRIAQSKGVKCTKKEIDAISALSRLGL